ncbi:hemicentin-2-like [Arapaima gigas]
MSFVNYTGPLKEGSEYQLLCDVQNVAPVQNLRVKWYKGDDVVNITTYSEDAKTPVNVSSTLLITPNRTDDGAQYKCEAELDLGPEGPQPPPAVQSEPLRVTVHYIPTISSASLTVLVIRGYSEDLNCSAEGNPPPVIMWKFNSIDLETNNGIYSVFGAEEHTGIYTCSATNTMGSDFWQVPVVLKEDYLPLIATLVAIIVVLIIVGFTVIYCIYYKNNKMGRYNLKDKKQYTQNGNVAHNGKDSNFAMKVLSIWV